MKSNLLAVSLLAIFILGNQPDAQAQEGAEVYDQSVQITPLLQTDKTNIGQPIKYPDTDNPEVTIVKVVIPPGAETGWHKHPVHGYAVILQGELNIKRSDGEGYTYRAGDAFAEMVDTIHRGENTGDEPVELIMFITGEKDLPFSVSAEPASAPGE